MLHHHFILVSKEHNQRRDIGVLSPIDINIKDKTVDSSQIRLQKWRDVQRNNKEFLLAHESGYHLDNTLKRLYLSFATALTKIMLLGKNDHSFVNPKKQDVLLASLYLG